MNAADQALIAEIKERLAKIPEDLTTVGILDLPFLRDVHAHAPTDLKALIELVNRLESERNGAENCAVSSAMLLASANERAVEYETMSFDLIEERDALKVEVEAEKLMADKAARACAKLVDIDIPKLEQERDALAAEVDLLEIELRNVKQDYLKNDPLQDLRAHHDRLAGANKILREALENVVRVRLSTSDRDTVEQLKYIARQALEQTNAPT